jgi:hypothetical protein
MFNPLRVLGVLAGGFPGWRGTVRPGEFCLRRGAVHGLRSGRSAGARSGTRGGACAPQCFAPTIYHPRSTISHFLRRRIGGDCSGRKWRAKVVWVFWTRPVDAPWAAAQAAMSQTGAKTVSMGDSDILLVAMAVEPANSRAGAQPENAEVPWDFLPGRADFLLSGAETEVSGDSGVVGCGFHVFKGVPGP